MKYRIFLIVSVAMTLLYALLIWLDIIDVEGQFGGIGYHLIVIAVLVFSCSRAFADAFKHGNGAAGRAGAASPTGEDNTAIHNYHGLIFLTATLGLVTITVFEIFSFAYIYLWEGSLSDITIGNYTRDCAYLFFIAALSIPFSGIFRKVLGIVSAFAAVFALCSVVIAERWFMFSSSAVLMLLCLFCAAASWYHSLKNPGLKQTGAFACAVIAICLLEIAKFLLIRLFSVEVLYGMVISLYPAIYLLLGMTLVSLPARKPDGEEVC
ncbi:MAG: hypothetical protein FWH14_05225 [Oscillospiraceae bacterium]|nr:hypothetical protein [Oscillospiraceae bacterium]